MAKRIRRTWGGARRGAGRPRKVERGEPLTIWLSGVDLERLQELAEDRGESVSQYVRSLLRRHIIRKN